VQKVSLKIEKMQEVEKLYQTSVDRELYDEERAVLQGPLGDLKSIGKELDGTRRN
jgi:hypothetical protein